jgi:hypothetical protein
MEMIGHCCYTLPLCRLDFSNDSDEFPELNADPANKAVFSVNIHSKSAHRNKFRGVLKSYITFITQTPKTTMKESHIEQFH